MNRPIDTTKKSNIKCEHCRYACDYRYECRGEVFDTWCRLKDKPKHYWNRCKDFNWDTDLNLKENDNETDNKD